MAKRGNPLMLNRTTLEANIRNAAEARFYHPNAGRRGECVDEKLEAARARVDRTVKAPRNASIIILLRLALP